VSELNSTVRENRVDPREANGSRSGGNLFLRESPDDQAGHAEDSWSGTTPLIELCGARGTGPPWPGVLALVDSRRDPDRNEDGGQLGAVLQSESVATTRVNKASMAVTTSMAEEVATFAWQRRHPGTTID